MSGANDKRSLPVARRDLRAARGRILLLLTGSALAFGCCAALATGNNTRTTNKPGDAEGLLIEEHFVLRPDGTRLWRFVHQTAVHTEYAIDELGDPRIVHDVSDQRLRVVRAVTTMRDGTKVAIKPNSINETTPDALVKAPAYADLRETVITHVGMELGCVNDLEVEIESDKSDAPFWGEAPLGRFFPTKRHAIKLVVPTDTTLRWECAGCTAASPKEVATGPGRELNFEWSGLAALNLREAGIRGHSGHAPAFGQPRLVFSTAASWNEVGEAFDNRFSTAAAVDDEVMNRAIELTQRAVVDEDKLMAVWRFVAKDIATIDWPIANLRFEPAAATQVLERSYGHVLDKAVLLSALLGASGIPSQPVLVSRDHLLAASVPALSQFDNVWVIAYIAGAERWLSPVRLVSGDGRALLEGRFAFDPQRPQPWRIELGADDVNRHRSVLSATMKLSADGAVTLDARATLTGVYGAFAQLGPEAGASSLLGGILGELAAGDFDTTCEGCYQRVRMLGPETASFAYKAQGKASGARRVRELKLPWAPRSRLAAAVMHRSTLHLPISLDSRGIEQVTVTLDMPASLELRSAPPAGKVDNAVGTLETTTTRDNGKLVITRTLQLKRRIIEPAHYGDLRALANELLRADARSLLFVEKDN